jgi:phage terminase large subunit GpA-like protein
MQVFLNTRLARPWSLAKSSTRPEHLKARAEDYPLRTVPDGALVLTAAADVQGNRIEVLVEGWGEGLEHWTVDHHIIWKDPAEQSAWTDLDVFLATQIRHASGAMLPITACAVDSGGHHTQEVYAFCGPRRRRNILAIKGHAKPGQPIIPNRPQAKEFTQRGQAAKYGVQVWMIGTDTAKTWLWNRWKFVSGPGAMHFSRDLPDEFYDQLCAEKPLVRWNKGHQRIEWIKNRADRNEALDLSVYGLFLAHYLGLHKKRPHEWLALRERIAPRQADIFNAPAVPESEQSLPQAPGPAPRHGLTLEQMIELARRNAAPR